MLPGQGNTSNSSVISNTQDMSIAILDVDWMSPSDAAIQRVRGGMYTGTLRKMYKTKEKRVRKGSATGNCGSQANQSSKEALL